MALIRPWAVAVVLGICVGFVARAQEPTTKPSSESREEKSDKKGGGHAGGRLFVPWSKMTSLTDDQKAKIREIHARTQAERKALEAKVDGDSRAAQR